MSKPKTAFVATCMVLGLVLIALMPSSQSFWVDEAVDAMYARQSHIKGLFNLLLVDLKSQTQMPLGMLTVWTWAKLLGTSEFALRSINMIWVAVTAYAFFRIGRKTGFPMLWLIVLVHPFIWYYADEARPYAMQIALGSWLLERMIHAIDDRRPEAALGLLIASVPFAAISIIHYIPLAVVAIITAAYAWPVWGKQLRRVIAYGSIGLLVHLPIICYYLFTLSRGAGGKKGDANSVSVTTLGYSIYELTGLFAFGPDRQEIRDSSLTGGLSAVLGTFSSFWPWLALICLLTAILFLVGLRQLVSRPAIRIFWACAAVLACSFLITAIAAIFKETVLWARHLSGVFPFLLLLVALPIAQLFSTPPTRPKPARALQTLAILTIIAFLVGSLRIRFAPDFKKVDNRAAARFAIANLEKDQTVFWAGIDRAGIHYLQQHPEKMHGRLLNRPEYVLSGQVSPDVAIIGRFAVDTPKEELRRKLAASGLRPHRGGSPRGFEFWDHADSASPE